MLTWIFAVFAGIIVLILLIALFTKKDYSIERRITISKPRQEVFNFIKYLKNHDRFNKWSMMDPHMKKEYTGVDGTVGFIGSWDSENKKVGKGEQQIIKIIDGERIDTELRFIKPFEGKGIASMSLFPGSSDETEVKWTMGGRSRFPFNLMNLFMDSMLGKDFETSLTNLKSILEKSIIEKSKTLQS